MTCSILCSVKTYFDVNFYVLNTCILDMKLTGEGTFGKVYKNGSHAIKVCPVDQTCYQREVEICNIIKMKPHHNIIKIVDSYTEINKNYIIMKYVPHTLQTFIHKLTSSGLRMKKVVAVGILHGLASALEFLRTLNIVHRDIKPSNILIENNECKLCDFGSAKVLSDNANTTYIVTRFYRAPELILDRYYMFEVDMWSYGCVAAEIALGQPLFQGENNVSQLCSIIKAIGINHDSLHCLKGREDIDCKFPKHNGQSWKRILSVIYKGRSCNVSYGTNFENLLGNVLLWNPTMRLTPSEILKHEFITST